MDIRVEDRPKAQAKTSRKAPPCALIIFGAGGDLTKRLLMPAIYNLAKEELLSERFAIIAVDRTPKPFDTRAWEFVERRIIHFAGDLTEPDTYARLYDLHERTAAQYNTGGNAVFYLAVAPQLFGTIIEQLGAVGLTQERDGY